MNRKLSRIAISALLVLAIAGAAVATALGDSGPTTGTNVACATVTDNGHELSVDGTSVYTISAQSTSSCNTVTYTVPTSTSTETDTTTATSVSTSTVTSTVTSNPTSTTSSTTSTTSSTTSSSTSSGGTAPTSTAGPYFAPSTSTDTTCSAGCAIQGQTLTATHGTWSCSGGCGTLTYAYQWNDCTTSGTDPPITGSCTPIADATSASYTVQSSDVGYSLVPTVTASNNGTAGAPTSLSGTCNESWIYPLGYPITSAVPTSAPAGCSPISAVVGTTQAAQTYCITSPVTCGYPDPVAGTVGVPRGTTLTSTTASMNLGSGGCNSLGNPSWCSPSGSTSCSSGTPCVISGITEASSCNCVISGNYWIIKDSQFMTTTAAGGNAFRISGVGDQFQYDTIQGKNSGTGFIYAAFNPDGSGTPVLDHILTNYVERIINGYTGGGWVLSNSFCMQNINVSVADPGSHLECTEEPSSFVADHNVMLNTNQQTADSDTYANTPYTAVMENNLFANAHTNTGSRVVDWHSGQTITMTNNRVARELYNDSNLCNGTPSGITESGNIWDDGGSWSC